MTSSNPPSSELRPVPAWFGTFQRWLRLFLALILGMTLGALALAYVMAGEIYEYQDSVDGVHLPEVDAIVCLAGGRGRIAAAGDIWYRYWELERSPVTGSGRNPIPGLPPTLYISGMGPRSDWRALARQLRRGVLDVIRPPNVLLETESINTDANARYLVRYAKQRGWHKILLMTSPYHMKRARFMFDAIMKDAGIPMEIETLSVFQEPFEPGEWRGSFHGVRVTVTEFLKWVYYKSFWKP
jgi:uncharacterized SAM-binding protein YcdF (DUF218 family)